MPLMHVAEFHAHHFKRSMNSKAAAHSGMKEDFPDAIHFWLWSLQYAGQPANDDLRPYARESCCDAITEALYFQIIDGFVAILKRAGPDFLTERKGFIRATRVMHQSFVYNTARGGYLAEYRNHYVAFHSWVDL